MTFNFQPKCDGMVMPLKTSFTGSKNEAYAKACGLCQALARLFKDHKFTIRIDRADAPAQGYEINSDGHTI